MGRLTPELSLPEHTSTKVACEPAAPEVEVPECFRPHALQRKCLCESCAVSMRTPHTKTGRIIETPEQGHNAHQVRQRQVHGVLVVQIHRPQCA